MWTLVLGVTFGLLASTRSAEEVQVNSRGCSYARVFQAEGEQRHSLNLSMAEKVCQKLDSVLANPDQVKEAYVKGLETCRNGWMNNRSAAILRHSHHFNCAKNMTGFIVLLNVKPEDQYDVYCYDEQAAPEVDCNKTFRVRNISSDNTTLTIPLPTDNKMELEGESEPISVTQPEETPDNDHGRSTPSPDNGITRQGFTLTSTVDSSKDFEGSGVEEGQPGDTITDADSTHINLTETEQESGKTVSESPQSTNDKELEPTTVNSHNQQLTSSSSNWLIILSVLVAIAAILVVCALIVYRKSLFGKRKTLMITKETNEGNGAAAASSSKTQEREQEMVTLMNKEKIQENGNTEEFTVITLEESPDKEQLA